jgi:hypothetical protein
LNINLTNGKPTPEKKLFPLKQEEIDARQGKLVLIVRNFDSMNSSG